MRTELGKITKAAFGLGGYQDAQIGLHLQFGGPGWGVGHSDGQWATKHSEHCKWTEQDRRDALGELAMKIVGLLQEAKVDSVEELVGIPVEVTFDGNLFKSFRILTEVL